MHRLPSKHSIRRLRMAALLMLGKCLLMLAGMALLVASQLMDDVQLCRAGLGTLACAGLLGVAQWVVATRACCPLCFGPVLADKQCAKHRRARRLLGSYRLRVASDIMTTNSFRCPFCGEPTQLLLRQKRR